MGSGYDDPMTDGGDRNIGWEDRNRLPATPAV